MIWTVYRVSACLFVSESYTFKAITEQILTARVRRQRDWLPVDLHYCVCSSHGY